MYARWITETHTIRGIEAIKKGEIRKILGKRDGLYILEGRDGKGSYGWTKKENIQILETSDEN